MLFTIGIVSWFSGPWVCSPSMSRRPSSTYSVVLVIIVIVMHLVRRNRLAV